LSICKEGKALSSVSHRRENASKPLGVLVQNFWEGGKKEDGNPFTTKN